MKYSQNDEEQAILDFFGAHMGRFLEIGAYNGLDFSNTLALVERGWSGVCVEPAPGPFLKLQSLHADRTSIKLVQAAIGDGGWHTFHSAAGDATSTLDETHRAKWDGVCHYQPFELLTVTVDQLLSRVGSNFDFISLDVEGTNWEVFKALPLDDPALKLICVEHEGRDREMLEKASWHGFKELHFNAENILLSRA